MEVKRSVLHILMFVATIIMVTLWVFSLGKNLFNYDTQVKIKQDLAPFSALKNNLAK